MTELLRDRAFFLSGVNPIANSDQRELEALAIRIFELPSVKAAKVQMGGRWKTLMGEISAEALSRFDELVEEFAFNYVLKAVNSDSNYPRILGHLYGPPHEWFGMKVPGSRGSGGDGPDQNYTIIPVDGRSRFELQGQRLDPRIGDVPFTLTGNLSLTMTLGSLPWHEVKFGADGGFVITLDPEPGNGRPNHVQTHIDARWLFIRDCRADWRHTVNAYRIKRLDPPTAPPLTFEQLADRACRYMIDDVCALFWFPRLFSGLEPNTITAPFGTGAVGGLVQQMISFSRIRLADDEAYVVTFGSGDAPFRDVVLHDTWFRTFEYWHHTSNMNNSQGTPNADGSTTYVISVQDPGLHNWLDTVGFHELLLVHRWQGLPLMPGPSGAPWATGEHVKLKNLARALPTGMRRVTPAERKTQLAERLASFKTRYVDS
jgi:hypothetical protein